MTLRIVAGLHTLLRIETPSLAYPTEADLTEALQIYTEAVIPAISQSLKPEFRL